VRAFRYFLFLDSNDPRGELKMATNCDTEACYQILKTVIFILIPPLLVILHSVLQRSKEKKSKIFRCFWEIRSNLEIAGHNARFAQGLLNEEAQSISGEEFLPRVLIPLKNKDCSELLALPTLKIPEEDADRIRHYGVVIDHMNTMIESVHGIGFEKSQAHRNTLESIVLYSRKEAPENIDGLFRNAERVVGILRRRSRKLRKSYRQ
jgi:hypothetical protein